MIQVSTIAEVRAAVAAARRAGQRTGFVPTMGFLHEGHLRLFDRARAQAGMVVASVYVNPLQFGPGEDFDRYPRDVARDAELAAARDVDVFFAPADAELYPAGNAVITVDPGDLGGRLCGAFRPGHFRGVLTVVAKLLNIVQPDCAVFGQKDMQQAVLVSRMVRDFDWPVEIDIAPTVREPDGLAMSSRNARLSPDERVAALAIHRGLTAAQHAFTAGERDASTLAARARRELAAQPGLAVQYVEAVDVQTLDPVGTATTGTLLAAAAVVGDTRLIDNVLLA